MLEKHLDEHNYTSGVCAWVRARACAWVGVRACVYARATVGSVKGERKQIAQFPLPNP